VGREAEFADAADVYRRVGRLIEEQMASPGVAARLAAVDGVVQYRCREPQATITVDLRAGNEPSVHFGPSDLEPLIVLTMDADVARALWVGELDPTIALARDQLSASGPVQRLLAVTTPAAVAATA
jgi:SCP-2 sterol transfer family protein